MSLEDLDNYCRKFSSMWLVFDELHSMRIHNDENCDAFIKEIKYLVKRINEESKELLETELR